MIFSVLALLIIFLRLSQPDDPIAVMLH
jgi:hypothetical protein